MAPVLIASLLLGQAGAYAQECLRLPDPGNIRMGRIWSVSILGWVQVKQGEFESGLALLQKGIDEWKATGALKMLPFSLILLADALSLAGQTEAGLETVASVVEMIERTGRRALEETQGLNFFLCKFHRD